MTWVFGTATNFIGTAICVADIQVTVNGEQTIDCLQKLYPMEQNILAGFAGNVETGFKMLEHLKRTIDAASAHGHPPDVERVLNDYSNTASAAYSSLPPRCHADGCEVLVAGASLVEKMIYNSQPIVARFRAPEFEVQEIRRGTWGSIGSGASERVFRSLLEGYESEEAKGLLQMEANSPGGYANAMFVDLVIRVGEMEPVKGVSQHFQAWTVTAHGWQSTTSDREFFPGSGTPRKIRMPPVASSWPALQAVLAKRLGSAPAVAVA